MSQHANDGDEDMLQAPAGPSGPTQGTVTHTRVLNIPVYDKDNERPGGQIEIGASVDHLFGSGEVSSKTNNGYQFIRLFAFHVLYAVIRGVGGVNDCIELGEMCYLAAVTGIRQLQWNKGLKVTMIKINTNKPNKGQKRKHEADDLSKLMGKLKSINAKGMTATMAESEEAAAIMEEIKIRSGGEQSSGKKVGTKDLIEFKDAVPEVLGEQGYRPKLITIPLIMNSGEGGERMVHVHYINCLQVAIAFVRALDGETRLVNMKGEVLQTLEEKWGAIQAALPRCEEESSRLGGLHFQKKKATFWGSVQLPHNLKYISQRGMRLSRQQILNGGKSLSVANLAKAVSISAGQATQKGAQKKDKDRALEKRNVLAKALKERFISKTQRTAVDLLVEEPTNNNQLASALAYSLGVVKPRAGVRVYLPLALGDVQPSGHKAVYTEFMRNAPNCQELAPGTGFLIMTEACHEVTDLFEKMRVKVLTRDQYKKAGLPLTKQSQGKQVTLHPVSRPEYIFAPLKGSPSNIKSSADGIIHFPSFRIERGCVDTIEKESFVTTGGSPRNKAEVIEALTTIHEELEDDRECVNNSVTYRWTGDTWEDVDSTGLNPGTFYMRA